LDGGDALSLLSKRLAELKLLFDMRAKELERKALDMMDMMETAMKKDEILADHKRQREEARKLLECKDV